MFSVLVILCGYLIHVCVYYAGVTWGKLSFGKSKSYGFRFDSGQGTYLGGAIVSLEPSLVE